MTNPIAAPALRGWLRAGEPLEFVVMSESMAPALRRDDVVRIAPLAAKELRIGDIVLLEAGEVYRVHRLVWRRGGWRTRGDALRRLDPPVDPDMILGRAVAVRRDGIWRPLPGFPWTLIPFSASLMRCYGGAALRLPVAVRRRASARSPRNGRKGYRLW